MPSWKKVITSGSNAVLHNITSSGDFKISGNISGSSTSTGSFGHGIIADSIEMNSLNPSVTLASIPHGGTPVVRFVEGTNFRGGFVKFDGASNVLKIGTHEASDSDASNDIDAITMARGTGIVTIPTSLVSNGNVTAAGYIAGTGAFSSQKANILNNFNNYIGLVLKRTGAGTADFLRLTDSSENIKFSVEDDGKVFSAGDISGSATSTGSFGLLTADNPINGGVLQLNGRAFSGTEPVGNISFFNKQNSKVIGKIVTRIPNFNTSGEMLFFTNNSEEDNPRLAMTIKANKNVEVNSGSLVVSGNISGSSTSTGSFGHVEATTISGSIVTSAQPNVTSLGTMTDVSGSATSTGSFGHLLADNPINGGVLSLNGRAFSGTEPVGNILFTNRQNGNVLAKILARIPNFNTKGELLFYTNDADETNPRLAMTITSNKNLQIESGSIIANAANAKISGSSSSTGSFGAIGIGTAPSLYKLNVEGTVRISGLSFYHNVNNPRYIWNSGNLSFRHGSPDSSNVILKLRSTKLESALEHHFDDKIVVSGDITGSGNLEIAGNISGSSTSTGSFGRIQASTIGGNSPLTIEADNFSVDSDGTVSGSNLSTGSFGNLRVGRAVFGGSINVTGVVDTTSVKASNNIETTGGNISGSATSTGSFGQVTLAGTYGIKIQDQKIGTNSANHVGASYLGVNSGASGNSSMNLNFVTPHQTYRFINYAGSDVGGESYAFYLRNNNTSRNPFIVVPSAADNLLTLANSKISGSSTSTGSFGRLEALGGGNATSIRIKGDNGSGGHVNNGNTYGIIDFDGLDDNGDYITGAQIKVAADSPTGAGDMPSRIQFFTRADGGSLTEAYKITDQQRHFFYGRGHFYSDQTYFGAEDPDGENAHSQIVVKAGIDSEGSNTHRSAWVQLRNARTSGGSYNYTDWLMGVHGSQSTNAALVFSNSTSMAGGSTWAQSQSLAIYPPGTHDRKVDVYKDLNVGVDDAGGNLKVYGNVTATGDIIAENFIVSSSVTYMTQSFSSGSTIFGDDVDDTHQFTGSVFIKGQAGGVGESLVLGSYGDGATQLMIRSNGASNPNIRIERGSSGNNFSIQNNGALNILRNSTALMTFKYTGEVGIGNSNPTKELTVEGEISASGAINAGAATFSSVLIDSGGGTLTLKDNTDDDDHRILFTNSSDATVFSITTPDSFNFTTVGSRNIRFLPNETEAARITSGGDFVVVGDVSGSATSTGSFGLVELSSNSSANASLLKLNYGGIGSTSNHAVLSVNAQGSLRIMSKANNSVFEIGLYNNKQFQFEKYNASGGAGLKVYQSAGESNNFAQIKSKTPTVDVSAFAVNGYYNGNSGLGGDLGNGSTGTVALIGKHVYLNNRGTAGATEGKVGAGILPISASARLQVSATENYLTSSALFKATIGDNTTGLTDVFTVTGDNKISGSSTSTGSFGHLMVGGGNFTSASLASAGGISNIVEDTSPQLGGDLDLNGNDITGDGNISTSGASKSILVNSTSGTSRIIARKDGVQVQLHSAGANGQGIVYSKSSGAAQSNYTFFIKNYDTNYLNLDSSGNLEVPVGNISGSSTSTGSFARVQTDDISSTGGSGNVFIKTSASSNKLGFDPANVSIFSNTTGIYLGSNNGSNSIIVGNGTGTNPRISKNGSGEIEFGSDISGSAQTTGSFGAGFFDDSVGIGVAPGNSSYMLNIEAAQTYAARFKSRKTSSSSAQRTMIAVGSGQTLGAGIYFSGPSSTNVSIGVKSDNKFHIAPGLNDIGDSSSNSLTVDSSGNVEINGDLSLDGTITEASTMRIKTNIETLESPLDKITKLRGVSYNLKKNKQPSIGMIAEEVEQIFPELVSKDEDGKAAAMSYGRMTAVLLEAIKELKQEVDELRQENIYIKDMNRKNK